MLAGDNHIIEMAKNFKPRIELIETSVTLCLGATACAVGAPNLGTAMMLGATSGFTVQAGATILQNVKSFSPKTARSLKKITDEIFELKWREAWGGIEATDPKHLDAVNRVLPKLLSQNWPTPQFIVSLSQTEGSHEEAIASIVLSNLIQNREHGPLFRSPTARKFTTAVIKAAFAAALSDPNYRAELLVPATMKTLDLTSDIWFKLEEITELPADVIFIKDATVRLESKVDELNSKVDQYISRHLKISGITRNKEADVYIKQTFLELFRSKNSEEQRLLDTLLGGPADPSEITAHLKKSLNELSEATSEIQNSKVSRLKQLIAVNYYSNSKEAILAYVKLIELEPKDVETLKQYGHLLRHLSKLKKAKKIYKQVYSIALDLEDRPLEAAALGYLGIVAAKNRKFKEAKRYQRDSLLINKGIGRMEGVAACLGSLGSIARMADEMESARDFYSQSLVIEKNLDSKEGQATCYANLGHIERLMNNPDTAERLFRKSLELNEELDRKEGIAICNANLGYLYRHKGLFKQAKVYLKTSRDINIELNRMDGLASDFAELGIIYQKQANFKKAKGYFNKSLKLNKKLGRNQKLATDYFNQGLLALDRQKFEKALLWFRKCYKLRTSIKAPNHEIKRAQRFIRKAERLLGQ